MHVGIDTNMLYIQWRRYSGIPSPHKPSPCLTAMTTLPFPLPIFSILGNYKSY